MPSYTLTNPKIQKYCENELKFNGVYKGCGIYSKSDEYEWIGAHWIALFVNDNNVTYFDSFGVEHIKIK